MTKERFQDPENTLYLIDISSFIFRAFFAIRGLKSKDGTPTNAVFGVANMLAKLAEEASPKYLACVFDSKEPSFRHEMYDQYKANRSEPPEDLIPQFDLIDELIQKFEIARVRQSGMEADDLIATLTVRWKALNPKHQVIIVSSDKDLMQLVDERAVLWDTMKEKIFDSEAVLEKFGVFPNQIRDYLAIVGDSSDNIPGISGIGPKGAKDLLKAWGTLEGVIEAAKGGKIPSRKGQAVIDNERMALLSQELATVKVDCPIEVRPSNFLYHFHLNPDCVLFFKKMDFHALLMKWSEFLTHEVTASAVADVTDHLQLLGQGELALAPLLPPTANRFVTVSTMAAWDTLLAKIKEQEEFAFDLETTSLNPREAQIVGIAFAILARDQGAGCKPGGESSDALDHIEAFYVPVGHALQIGEDCTQLTLAQVMKGLGPVLADPKLKKIGQNLKYDLEILKVHQIDVEGIGADTMVAAYNLDPEGRHNMDFLARKYLDYEVLTFEQVCGKGKEQITFDQVSIALATRYSAEDAWVTLKLWKTIEPKLRVEGLFPIFENVDMPLVEILTQIEMTGVRINVAHLNDLSREFSREIEQIEKSIAKFTDGPVNLNSTKQLAHLLFDVLKLPVQAKTKTGYSTDAAVLETLSSLHEVPKILLEYREISKLKSTYIEPLPKMVDSKTDRIHTSYHQTGTSTGRLSSSDPNLQNIPIRSERGMRIRKAFIASQGNRLLAADYSQIELRLLAEMSGDQELTRSFFASEDVHRRTASEMFGVVLSEVSDHQRSIAKAINFGLMYGKTPFGLALELKISRTEASQMIEKYFSRYFGVKKYLEDQVTQAKALGYVKTLLGRKRTLADIRSANPAMRANAERMAMNTPIQGTAADLMKIAMIEICKSLRTHQLASQMILQVHDEIVLDCPLSEITVVEKIVTEAMEQSVLKTMPMKIPLRVNVGVGESWADL